MKTHVKYKWYEISGDRDITWVMEVTGGVVLKSVTRSDFNPDVRISLCFIPNESIANMGEIINAN